MNSGASDCRPRAKAHASIRCYSCWWRIGSYPRAVSGACIGAGLSAARLPICWVPMPRWPTFIRSTPVTTDCSSTSRRCSITWWVAGGIYSMPASTCSCMTSLARISSPIRRQLKWLWERLKKLSTMKLTRDALLMKLGAAQTKAPAAWRLIEVELTAHDVPARSTSFTYRLDRDKLRQVRRREGRYLLRTNLTESDPAKLWQFSLQLVQVEAAFRTLQGDLAIRPIFHQE